MNNQDDDEYVVLQHNSLVYAVWELVSRISDKKKKKKKKK